MNKRMNQHLNSVAQTCRCNTLSDEEAEGKLRTKQTAPSPLPPIPGWDVCDIPQAVLARKNRGFTDRDHSPAGHGLHQLPRS